MVVLTLNSYLREAPQACLIDHAYKEIAVIRAQNERFTCLHAAFRAAP